jgi:GxxExxY protein
MEVHRHLGPGFLEACYERAVAIELMRKRVPIRRQVPIDVRYKGEVVSEHRLDLLVDGRLVVEPKAVEQLLPLHLAQMRAYLRATNCPLGLLINFNVGLLRDGIRRVIATPGSPSL